MAAQQLVPISFGPCFGNDGFDLSKAVELREIGLGCERGSLVFGLDSSLAIGSWCQGQACSASVSGELRPKCHFASVTPARMNWEG